MTFAGPSGATGSIVEVGATGSLTVTGGAVTAVGAYNLQLNGPNSTFTNSAGITVSTGVIEGLGVITSAITATGAATIQENQDGTLEITGKISGGTTALKIGENTNDLLLLDAAGSAVTSVNFGLVGNSGGTLEIGGSGSLSVANALAVGLGTLTLDGAGTAQLTDANGITLAGGDIQGTGTIATATKITGYGTVAITLANGTSAAAIEASGGTLDLNGAVNQSTGTNRALVINTTAGSDLEIGGTASSGAISIVNANQELQIGAAGALTITGAQTVYNGKIVLDGGSLTDSSGVVLGSGTSNGSISGSGKVVASVTRGGTGAGSSVNASGGTLEIDGPIGLPATPVGALSIGSGLTDELLLYGVSFATEASFSGSTGMLAINTAGALTLASALALGANSVELEGAGTQLTDTAGVTLAGGEIEGAGTIAAATGIDGWGTIAIPLTTGAGTITADGGVGAGETTLDLQGAVSGRTLAIGVTNASDLKIDGTASSGAISITNANQTLDIGASGALTLGAIENAYDGDILLDGGTLTDSSGITLGNSARTDNGSISGWGKIVANIDQVGAGTANTITASGGTLEIDGNVGTSGTPVSSLVVGAGLTDELLLDGASYATSASFLGSTGTLAIGASGALTLTIQLTIGTGDTLQLDGTGVQFTDAGGVTLAGGLMGGTGTVSGSTGISGWGTVDIPLSQSEAIAANASDDTLELQGAMSGASALAIGSGATLLLDGSDSATSASFTGTGGTLEIGAAGSLSLTNAPTVGPGDIVQLDSPTDAVQLTDAAGVTVAGGTLVGTGTIATTTTITGYGTVGIDLLNGTGAGTITASGGMLDLTGQDNQGAATPNRALAINTTSVSALKIDGSATSDAITINNVNQ